MELQKQPSCATEPICTRVGAAALLCLSIAWFAYRAILPSGTLWDFGVTCSASQAWLTGHNPYDAQSVARWWQDHARGSNLASNVHGLPVVNAPGTLVAFAPFAFFSPETAAMLWLICALALIVVQVAVLQEMARVKRWGTAGMLLAAAVMAFAPLIHGVLTGQPAVPAVSLLIIAAWASTQARDRTAGILLGVSAAIKFQIGLPFLFLYFVMGRGRIGLWGAATFMLLTFIAVAGLKLGGTPWLSSWFSALHEVGYRGGLNDFDPANPDRNQLLNLQMIFSELSSSRLLVNGLSLLVSGLLAAALAGYIRLSGKKLDELLVFSIAATICLMPVYHRVYDAILLVVITAWIAKHFSDDDQTTPRLLALLLLTFMLPTSFGRGASHWLNLLQALHAVMLLATAIVLLYKAATLVPGWREIEYEPIHASAANPIA